MMVKKEALLFEMKFDPVTKKHTAQFEVELTEWEFGIFKEKLGGHTPVKI